MNLTASSQLTSPTNPLPSERFPTPVMTYCMNPSQPQTQQFLVQQPTFIPPFTSAVTQMQSVPVRTNLANSNMFIQNPASLGFRKLLAEMSEFSVEIFILSYICQSNL